LGTVVEAIHRSHRVGDDIVRRIVLPIKGDTGSIVFRSGFASLAACQSLHLWAVQTLSILISETLSGNPWCRSPVDVETASVG
jgi:hypothetical protein